MEQESWTPIVIVKTPPIHSLLNTMSEPRPAAKIWLETNEGYVFGPGVYNLLIAIREKGTLKEASQSLDMSYRFAWGLIKKAEEKLGAPLIDATKGGRRGGGSSHITELGEHYIMDFEKIQKMWQDFKEQYDNSVLVEARVVDSDNDLVVRIDDDIDLGQGSGISKDDLVMLRVQLA
jgi:molybdate transport repressor ModE-like protein